MKEIRNIIRQFDLKDKSEQVALATVVRVEGSSYRRMGARMLVSENGTWVGGISGGCLEGDALKRARMAIIKSSASVITYDTTTDDDHQIGVGLGCNGIIDVLFKPIEEIDSNNPIQVLKKALSGKRQTRKLVCITHCTRKELLGNILLFENKDDLLLLSDYTGINELASAIDQLDKSKNLIVNESLTLFVEVLPPALQILLIGHQYDLYPLSRQIRELGWDQKVIANPTKVNANEGLEVIAPEFMDEVEKDEYTAVILMSHSLNTDKDNLRKVLGSTVKYIGMLGPKVRSERIIAELKEEGVIFTEKDMERIYAPIGLDIGASNPEEIALSIVAEIKTVFSQRNGKHLRERAVPIHDRDQPMKFD